MQITIEESFTVSDIATEFNCHPDNVRLYKRELNQILNKDDFDWVGYTKRISKEAYNILKTYHFLIKDYGKKEAKKLIKQSIEG
jgi:hypothetical protein